MYIVSIAIVTVAFAVVIYSQISESFTSRKTEKKAGN
jgi:hypothetical protein